MYGKKYQIGLGIFFLITRAITSFGQSAPYIVWAKCYGGEATEQANSISPTFDRGFLVAGLETDSLSTDSFFSANHGGYDNWIIKINDTGRMVWSRILGGSGDDEAESIIQTRDSGSIFVGFSNSNDRDIVGNHGGYDAWVVKLNDTGGIQWQKSLGGTSDDYGFSIQQTSDNGYIVACITSSNDGDVSGVYHGDFDYWIVKLTDSGRIEWQKTYGGTNDDQLYSIQQTKDHGYIAAGFTRSTDGDISGNHGDYDYWVLKLNDTGKLLWQKCFGGSDEDRAFSVMQTIDGNYVVAGYTGSNDGQVTGNHGWFDYWIVKFNDTGNILWQKCYGGSSMDQAVAIRQTSDSGYIVSGTSTSDDSEVTGHHESPGVLSHDYWVVKLNDTGKLEWENSFGGVGIEVNTDIQLTADSCYIMTGYTSEPDDDGDVHDPTGYDDYWIVKIKDTSKIIKPTIIQNKSSNNNFIVYPTHTNAIVNVIIPIEHENAMMKVFNELGQEINVRQNISGLKRQLYFDNQPAGLYFIRILDETSANSYKILYNP
ncbi:MAG TPA: T9SS type A sorting domain-containing protein [Flavipsychrobacter sp.]|nr:T9SS type A sorting domain-containing protein [Flavipsychrobacter sp.]